MLKRSLIFVYGLGCYLAFLGTYLYTIGFVANAFVPRSIDSIPDGDLATNITVDLALLFGFGLQHSVMARPAFKRWWTQWIPQPAERSTYVLASSVALLVLFAFWRPLGGMVWSVQEAGAAMALYVLCAFGFLLVLFATFLINHFDLFGLRQVWRYLIGAECQPIAFRAPGLYRVVRHPLYLGWMIAFWATPVMSVTHLLFAVGTSFYILFAVRLEERELLATLGDAYREYHQRVPMLIPFSRVSGERG